MEQRTAMLNGVSHDLRTILTRFKLQLALAGDNPDLEGLDKDVEDMQSMLEAYLTFARTDVEEDVGTLELPALLEKIGHDFELHGKKFSYELYNVENIIARPNALSRLVANLAENARRYASNLHIDIRRAPRSIIMTSMMMGRAFRKRHGRMCSSRSSGWMKHATSMPRERDLASPSCATSPAAMAATCRWMKARWADCG